jgi:hypothetical protein
MSTFIRVEPEQIDAIVVQQLKECYAYLTPENRPACGMYYRDEATDLQEIAHLRNAFALVLDYYGEKV